MPTDLTLLTPALQLLLVLLVASMLRPFIGALWAAFRPEPIDARALAAQLDEEFGGDR